jgi:hypothetical protein
MSSINDPSSSVTPSLDEFEVLLKRVGPSISCSDTIVCGHIEVQRSDDLRTIDKICWVSKEQKIKDING